MPPPVKHITPPPPQGHHHDTMGDANDPQKKLRPLSYNWCRCKWHDCGEKQKRIAEHCYETKQNHPLLGYYRLQGKSPEVQALRKNIELHLGHDFPNPNHLLVARHHFPIELMERNGNHKNIIQVGDDIVELPPLSPPNGGTNHLLSTPLSARDARQYGIHHNSEKAAHKGQFLQAPIATPSDVDFILNSWSSSRSFRAEHRAEHHAEHHSNNTLPAPIDLFPDSSSPFAIGPLTIIKYLQDQFNKYKSRGAKWKDSFLKCIVVFQLLHLYCRFHNEYSTIFLGVLYEDGNMKPQNIYCLPCSAWAVGDEQDGCEILKIGYRNDVGHVECGICANTTENVKRRKMMFCDGRDIHQNTNNRYLTREQLEAKTKTLQNSKRYFRKVYRRLKHDKDALYIHQDDTELHSLLHSAAEHVTSNREEASKKLLESVIEHVKQNSNVSDSKHLQSETCQLVDEIMNEITNWATKAAGRSKMVRFSPQTMRIALSLYVDSKKGYESFAASSIRPMPSVPLLKKLKRLMTPKEGTFPALYGWLRDSFELKNSETIPGLVMCDQMHLISDFYFNPMNHLCTGVVINNEQMKKIQLADEVMKLMKDDATTQEDNPGESCSEEENSNSDFSVSLSVNQFRVRTFDNRTHFGEFFFDNGSISGDELVRQIKQVIIGMEMAGVRICAVSMDGGGSNVRAAKLFCGGEVPPEDQYWLDEKYCSFVNPADPKRRVAIFFCSTHNGKAGRNALLNTYDDKRSSKKPPRDFTIGDIHFNWDTIRRLYAREKRKSVKDTHLSREAEHPDRWNKMNVGLVKQVFHHDVLTELTCHAIGVLERLSGETFKEELKSNAQTSNTTVETTLEYVVRLKEWAQKTSEKDGLTDDEKDELMLIQSDIFALEYLAHMCNIYTNTLMNRRDRLTQNNIASMRERLEPSLQYLHNWKLDQLEYKEKTKNEGDTSSKEWQKRFISPQSYLNWRMGICGFFLYAQYVWELEPNATIPFLHSNTSILEAFFSQVRASHGDTPLKYAGIVGTVDSKNSAKMLFYNPMYDAEDTTDGESPSKSIDRVTRRRDLERNNVVEGWIQNRKVLKPKLISLSGSFKYAEHGKSKGCQATQMVMDRLNTDSNVSYLELIVNNGDFLEYAKLSVGTTMEAYFRELVCLRRRSQLNNACQYIWDEIEKGCQHFGDRKGKAERSFMILVYRLQIDEARMKIFVEKMPQTLKTKDNIPNIFHRVLVDFVAYLFQSEFLRTLDEILDEDITERRTVEQIIQDAMDGEEEKLQPSKPITPNDEKKEVQCFLGYGLGCAVNKLEKEEYTEDTSNNVRNKQILEKMVISKEELKLRPKEQIQLTYPRIVDLKNDRACVQARSEMTLVSPEFFEFGKKLLHSIRFQFNQNIIKSEGDLSAKLAWESLLQNGIVKEEFYKAIPEEILAGLDQDGEDAKQIDGLYYNILKKTFNARVGAEVDQFKEDNTSRYAAKAVDVSLRGGLKVKGKKMDEK